MENFNPTVDSEKIGSFKYVDYFEDTYNKIAADMTLLEKEVNSKKGDDSPEFSAVRFLEFKSTPVHFHITIRNVKYPIQTFALIKIKMKAIVDKYATPLFHVSEG